MLLLGALSYARIHDLQRTGFPSRVTDEAWLLGAFCVLLLLLSRSDSVRPHRPHKRQPTRLYRPWDSPGKNTGVGCHFLVQCMKVKSESEVAQSCPTLRDPMDCSPPGSSVHGIFQARVLEWVSLLCSKVLLKYNSDRESFWHRH